MPNTIENIKEATDLVNQLVQKTLAKKVFWVRVDYVNDYGDVDVAFETQIPGGFKFGVCGFEANSASGYEFRMSEEGGVELLRVRLESSPRWGYSLIGEEELASSLARLYELARRDSLNVDQKVNEAKSLLLAL